MKKAVLIFFLISMVCIPHAQVICNNIPPVAIAGNDTTIQNKQASCSPVPVTITLNGSRSYNPYGIIVSYLWIGPNGITNPIAAITTVTGLTLGTYMFILKVTDNYGAFAYDTVRISIIPANRPLIPAHLIPVGKVPESRGGMAFVAAGNKIVFAGGSASLQNGCATARVDIYDINSGIWTMAQLPEARVGAAATVLGNRIFFGGGIVPELYGSVCGIWNFMRDRSAAVDIYDVSANTWDTAQLGRARYPTAATAANKVFFAGGEATFPLFSNKAFDTYDASTNIWSNTLLNNTGPLRTPLAVGNKIYYAGGIYDGNIGNWPEVWASKRIDIYDADLNIWSVDSLSAERAEMGAILANNKIYWAGGWAWDTTWNEYAPTSSVEIRDIATNTTSFDCLSQPKTTITAVRKDNKIIFFGGSQIFDWDKFDIYDLTTDSWSIGVLPHNLYGSIISYMNTLYVADDYHLWKLEIDGCTNSSSSIINTSACETYTLNGQTYTRSGIYTQKLLNAANCDSIITLNLTINYSTNCTMSVTACDSYFWQGQTYTVSGFYSDTLVSSHNCDSILNLNLTINNKVFTTKNAAICQGQNYAGKTVAGTYVDTLRASNGCDSICTLNLAIKPRSFSSINAAICEGQNYGGHTSPGIYIDTLIAGNGCDSIITLYLTISKNTTSNVSAAACNSYNWNGQTLTVSGTYKDTLVSTYGCDSIVTLYLTISPGSFSSITQTICTGQIYSGYSVSGTYIDTLISTNGCDSIRTLQLTVLQKPAPDLGIDKDVCPGDSLILYPGQYTNYLWQNGSSQSHLIVKQPGMYSVTVTDHCGTARDEIVITDGFCDIYFPSAFTPNNDGKNDLFKIPDVYHVSNYHLVVYNRWGQKVFETTNPSNGWAGGVNGKPQNTGVFTWHCEFRKPGNADLVKMKGTVMLIK